MKRIISFFIAMIFILSTAACGKKVNESDVIDSDTTITEEETEAVVTEAPVEMIEYDVSDFVIAYGDLVTVDYAQKLKTELKKVSGIDLKVVRYKENTYDFAFIFGESNALVSKKFFVNEYNKYYNHVGLLNDNGIMQVLGYDKLTLNSSIEYICNTLVSEKKTKFVAPSTGVISNIITHESISLPQRADDSYLRIVSNNILLQSLNSSGDRLGGLRSAFMYYDADIFGLQEVDDLWHNAAKLDQTMKTIGYSMVPINPTDSKYANLEDKDIRNPIYYKTDKFELVDCGYDRYAATEFDNGEYPSSSYTWACLKLKESGKQLIVISTHLVARINHSGATVAQTSKSANTYREESVNELLKVVEGLNEKYPNVPVISVGDYNNNYSSKTYALMGKLFYSARTRAEKRVNMSYHSSGNPIGGEPPEGKAIDHIFYSKTGITAKHFETLVSPYSYAYSDHVPVLMDFILE